MNGESFNQFDKNEQKDEFKKIAQQAVALTKPEDREEEFANELQEEEKDSI